MGSEISRENMMKNIKCCLKWVDIGRGESGISASGSKNDAEFDFDRFGSFNLLLSSGTVKIEFSVIF
jgi:hypothetical protein